MSEIERGTGRPDFYRLADGSKVPSVTTILGRWKESGGLLQWAFKQGQSGAKTLYEKRDKAADAGSLVHACVEADIHHLPHPEIPKEHEEAVRSAYAAWKKWFTGSRITIIATEVALVSETYKFGGTIDSIGVDADGMICLPDWKSSSGLYTDYVVQIAAYGHLWYENRHQRIEGYHLCRFSKEHGDFEHRYFPDLKEAWELFKLLLPAYHIDKKLKERVR